MFSKFSKKKPSSTEQHDDHQETGQPSKKKNVKNRSIRPKGFVARKAGVITFWTLFGFMLLVVFVNVFGSSGEANADQEIEIKMNKAMSQEAVQFAKDFSQDYFTWVNSTEGIKLRQEALAKYLGSNINEHAGLGIENLSWNSKFVDASVKGTEDKGDNVSNITLKVNFKLYQLEEDGVTVKDEKAGVKYFVVPVAYDGNSFGVYQLPKFTYVQEGTTLDKVTYAKLKRAEGKDTTEVKNFLTTFFRSYAGDPQDQLNYILAKDNLIQGLNKTMTFDKVKSVEVFKFNENKEFIVYAEVTFIDPDTGIPFDTNYQLTAIQKNGKYVVSGMDDHKGQSVKQNNTLNLEEKKVYKEEEPAEKNPTNE